MTASIEAALLRAGLKYAMPEINASPFCAFWHPDLIKLHAVLVGIREAGSLV